MLQNKNKMVNALANADMVFTHFATCITSFPASRENKRAIIWNVGAPGS